MITRYYALLFLLVVGGDVAATELPQTIVQKNLAPDRLAVVHDQSGVPVTITGKFALGLSAAGSWSPTDIAPALTQFLQDESDLFNAHEVPTFAVYNVRRVNEERHMADVAQVHEGIRIWDSELTVVFYEDGTLHSFNGLVAHPTGVVDQPTYEMQPAVALALRLGPDFKIDRDSAGLQVWRNDSGETLELGIDDSDDSLVWRAVLASGTHWIDNDTLTETRFDSHDDPAADDVSKSCTVTFPNYPRDSVTGRASNVFSQSGTQSQALTCGGDSWFGTCYWHLKRQSASTSHPIARIDDVDTAEEEVVLSCSSATALAFNATSGDALREQTAFWGMHQGRGYIKQNVWDNIVPDRTTNVDAHIDDTVNARWNDFLTDIRATTSESAFTGMWLHEYGHYVVWSYNDVSENCVNGGDQGNAIDETMANIFSMIALLDDVNIDPEYGALANLGNQAPSPHLTGGAFLDHGDRDCITQDFHFVGNAFEQAIWEILFNANCSPFGSGCTNDSGHLNALWVGETREAVLEHVGTAAGAALKQLGTNIRYDQIAAHMLDQIQADSGATTRGKVYNVFHHHGIY